MELRGRIHHAADEQDGPRLDVADQEDEGAIHGDLDRLFRYAESLHDHRGGRRRFRARLVHGDEGLVDHVGDEQVAVAGHAREVRRAAESSGHAHGRQGVGQLDLLGISSIANVLSAIKFARWYELGETDIVLTVFTDSMELYGSRLRELHEEHGEYSELDAAADYHRYLLGCTVDYVEEMGTWDRRRIHNLKYYTWVEQQGKTTEEIQAQWYDADYWSSIHRQVEEIDALIEQFNERTGLLKDMGQ